MKHSKETKEKIRQKALEENSFRGKRHSLASKERMRLKALGNQRALGVVQSEETCKKRRETISRPEVREKYRKTGQMGYQKAFRSISGPHKEALKILESLGLECEIEKLFDPYSIDIYIPSLNLAVEIDGRYWHRNRQSRDRARDAYLKSHFGLQTIRVWEDELEKLMRIVLEEASGRGSLL